MGQLASGCALGAPCSRHPCRVVPNAGLQSSPPRVGASSTASPHRTGREESDPRLPLPSPGSWGERSPPTLSLPRGTQAPHPPHLPLLKGTQATGPSSSLSKRRPGDPPLSAPSSRGIRASGPCHLPAAPERGAGPRSCPAPTAGHGSQRRHPTARVPSPLARPSPGKRFLPPRPQPIGERRWPRRARPHTEGPMRARGRGRAGRRCLPPWWAVKRGGADGPGVLGRVWCPGIKRLP